MIKVKRLTKHIPEVEEKIQSEIDEEHEKQALAKGMFKGKEGLGSLKL